LPLGELPDGLSGDLLAAIICHKIVPDGFMAQLAWLQLIASVTRMNRGSLNEKPSRDLGTTSNSQQPDARRLHVHTPLTAFFGWNGVRRLYCSRAGHVTLVYGGGICSRRDSGVRFEVKMAMFPQLL